jgi:hypothetical protein
MHLAAKINKFLLSELHRKNGMAEIRNQNEGSGGKKNETI